MELNPRFINENIVALVLFGLVFIAFLLLNIKWCCLKIKSALSCLWICPNRSNNDDQHYLDILLPEEYVSTPPPPLNYNLPRYANGYDELQPPSYEIALIVSRPTTPEPTEPASNILTQNANYNEELQPPSYEFAISLSSAESSRRSSSVSQFKRPAMVQSYPLLLNYEDAMRNSRPATPVSLQ